MLKAGRWSDWALCRANIGQKGSPSATGLELGAPLFTVPHLAPYCWRTR